MRYILSLFSCLLIGMLGFSQVSSSQLEPSENVYINNLEFVIGIGNSENELFNSVLDYLQNNSGIEVYAICYSHNIIGFKTMNNEYKSYDVIRDDLIIEFENLILLRKNDEIFTRDCNDEILKQ